MEHLLISIVHLFVKNIVKTYLNIKHIIQKYKGTNLNLY